MKLKFLFITLLALGLLSATVFFFTRTPAEDSTEEPVEEPELPQETLFPCNDPVLANTPDLFTGSPYFYGDYAGTGPREEDGLLRWTLYEFDTGFTLPQEESNRLYLFPSFGNSFESSDLNGNRIMSGYFSPEKYSFCHLTGEAAGIYPVLEFHPTLTVEEYQAQVTYEFDDKHSYTENGFTHYVYVLPVQGLYDFRVPSGGEYQPFIEDLLETLEVSACVDREGYRVKEEDTVSYYEYEALTPSGKTYAIPELGLSFDYDGEDLIYQPGNWEEWSVLFSYQRNVECVGISMANIPTEIELYKGGLVEEDYTVEQWMADISADEGRPIESVKFGKNTYSRIRGTNFGSGLVDFYFIEHNGDFYEFSFAWTGPEGIFGAEEWWTMSSLPEEYEKVLETVEFL